MGLGLQGCGDRIAEVIEADVMARWSGVEDRMGGGGRVLGLTFWLCALDGWCRLSATRRSVLWARGRSGSCSR